MVKGIYQYVDLKNMEVVYVGKDSHIDKNKRHKHHLSPSCYNKQVINRVLQNNPERYEYQVIYAGDFDEDLLNVLEINTIAEEQPKFNFTNGGDGMVGFKHSDETRKKLSLANTGKTLSDETRKKMSIAHTGKTLSEETKKKISENHADFSGENHPQAKYTLWNIESVHYHKSNMFQKNRQPNPCKCFQLKYNGKHVKIGLFHDFLTVEIISDLIKEATQK